MKMLLKCGIVLLTLAQTYNGSPLIMFSSDIDDIDNRVIEDENEHSDEDIILAGPISRMAVAQLMYSRTAVLVISCGLLTGRTSQTSPLPPASYTSIVIQC